VCQCICVSVCEHSDGRTYWSIFTKIGIDVRIPKAKRVCWVSISHHPLQHFALQNPHSKQRVLKIHANINNFISELHVRDSPKFLRQILDRKWKYGRFSHAQWQNMQHIRNLWPNRQTFAYYRKLGLKNTTVTSNVRPELEIWPFPARAMKSKQYNCHCLPHSYSIKIIAWHRS